MKKNTVTQDLANIYPPESDVRSSDQSEGFRLLNVLADPMEDMSKQIEHMAQNRFLVTANLDEIDISYRVQLGDSFSFDENTTDPAILRYETPVVSGTIGAETYNVRLAPDNNLRSYWYDSVPDRVSLLQTVTGVDHVLHTFVTDSGNQAGTWEHHLGGGDVWIQVSNGKEYVRTVDGILLRGGIALDGTTRKGSDEMELIVFPWDMHQKSQKEWEELSRIEVRDMPDGVDVVVTSANFGSDDYLDFYNLSHSTNSRRKIDTFWGLGTISGLNTLDMIRYNADEWEQLILGFVDKEIHRSWELLDSSGVNITPVDMTLQPFQERAWVVTADELLVYDTTEEMITNYSHLRGATDGADIRFEFVTRSAVLGEDFEFIPWHARPILPIKKYRVFHTTPGGTKEVYVNGSPTTWDPSYWVVLNQTELTRDIAPVHTLTPSERGEYLITFEAVFDDDSEQGWRYVLSVDSKSPVASFDISSLVDGVVSGVDFDADQKLWVWTSSGYYQLDTHTDIMLIDFTNKLLYLHEQYDQVEVITDG